MELERQEIERRDFSPARRGYDPDEVDRHLREVSDAVNELKRSRRTQAPTIAATAAEQVRTIVEAAERSAAEIQQRAEEEARRIVDEATTSARQTRESADSDAASHVQKVEDTTRTMLQRAGSTESEIDRLLESVRSSANALVEELRTGAGSLQTDLEAIRTELSDLRDARPGASLPVEPPPVSFEEDEEPVEAELVEPDIADEGDTSITDETDAVSVDGDEVVEEAEPQADLEEEPEPEPEVRSARRGDGGGTRAIAGSEGARLIALNMALNGTPRDETARYLSDNFDLEDQDVILDEVYERVGDA